MLKQWYKYRSALGFEYWSELPPEECADHLIDQRGASKEPKD